MATGHSSAYTSFRRALAQANALIRMERTLSDPPATADIPLAEGLRGGAVVLMVASFEAFLRDVFEERLDHLGSTLAPGAFDRLPARVQTSSVFNLLQEAMHGAPGKPVPKDKIDRLAGIRGAAAGVSSKRVMGTAFSTTGSNPSSTTVKELFKQVDYSDIFGSSHSRFQRLWRSPVARDFPARQLDFIVSARHEIAHGANVLAWSRADLRDAERLVRVLGNALDDELRIHVNRLTRV